MKKKKKKKNALRKFLYVFLKSIFILFAFFVLGFISYKITLLYYDNFGGPEDDKVASIINDLYGEVEVTDVSKNLIYAMGDDNELKAVVLEILNTNTNNLDYITIPLKSQFVLSNELYQKLCASGCDVPQIMKLSHLDDYFTNKTMYEYGVILMEDLIDIDINYYTVVPVHKFKEMFKQGDAFVAYAGDGSEMQSYYEWHLKKSYIKKIAAFHEEEWKDYIKKISSFCESNLNTRSKLEYVDNYARINPNLIYEHSLYGTLNNNDFEINVEATNEMIQTILSNASYTIEQADTITTATTKVSLGYTIQILNASQINGLAAQYKEMFTTQGYSIASIGNYTGEMASQTKILVNKEGLGTDFLTYFTNAVVEKAELPYGCDIQIVLGTDAKTERYE
ncbi:MAG: LytR C-terminal domain-containing protein [Velocimicrobium sp.]